jgi:hypothetical protein
VRRADNGTWNHVDTTMAHSGYAKTRERAGQLLRRRYARMVPRGRDLTGQSGASDKRRLRDFQPIGLCKLSSCMKKPRCLHQNGTSPPPFRFTKPGSSSGRYRPKLTAKLVWP